MVHASQLMQRLVSSLVLSAGTLAIGVADEVYLHDGRVIEGEITSATNAEMVDIRVGNGSLSAVQHFERAKIRRITYGTTARQVALAELQSRRAKLGDAASVADCWSLAQDAKTLGDTVLYKDLAAQVVARDRQHPEARKALGLVLYNGVWMRPSEAAAARGEVFFRGQWIAWIDRDAIVADESRRREEFAAARKIRDEQRRQAAAASAAAASVVELQPETTLIGYRSSPLLTPYRSLYWPTNSYSSYTSSYGTPFGGYQTYGYSNGAYCPPGHLNHGPIINLNASGGGSHHAWSFSWRL